MLQAIREHGSRLGGEPGFTTREVRWCIELNAVGEVLNVLPMGEGESGVMVRGCPDTPGMNSGGKAQFLVESAKFATLFVDTNEAAGAVAAATRRHEAFRALVIEAQSETSCIAPLVAFLASSASISRAHCLLTQHGASPNHWITWLLDAADPLRDEVLMSWWRKCRLDSLKESTRGRAAARTAAGQEADVPDADADAGEAEPASMVCLLSGAATEPLAKHDKITGLAGIGGLGPGDVLVSFDKAAFRSFGLQRSANAAMSEQAAKDYVVGLNDLIRNHSRKLANALVVYWFKEQVAAADDPLAFLYGLESEEQTSASALAQARRLLAAVQDGSRVDLAGNAYYAMMLSGASGRVMVRDWIEGSFENLTRSITRWFEALEIVGLSGKRPASDPKFETVVTCLLPEKPDSQKYADWVKPIGAVRRDLWRTALDADAPLPPSVLARICWQLPAFFASDALGKVLDATGPEPNAKSGLTIARLCTRMALIKAYFIRKQQGAVDMKPHLNPEHPSPAYHCGRLLAALADLQRDALGSVGAGVVQRFYPAASQTPGLTLGRLIGNSRNHLNKLPAEQAAEHEERIAQIIGCLGDAAPRNLDLEGQGLFALGYYQQLAHLRS
ncbi:MAG: type I-C CRISPR-associated protein Cas8c/Csd1 [Vicinamibacteria bacterium]